METTAQPHATTLHARAPWSLRAEAYLLVVRLPRPRGRPELFAADELPDARFGPLGVVMYVDYLESPVGPYRELLLIPGTFRPGSRRLPAVTKIYVSSEASVVSGRRNWGLPKEYASFEVERGPAGSERVRVAVGGERVAELVLAPRGFALPITSALVPRRFRTLGQVLEGRHFEVTPRARALVQPAHVGELWSNPARFVSMSTDNVLLALRLRRVCMEFPEARVY